MDDAVNLFFTPYREGLPLLLFLWLTEIGTGATGAAVVLAVSAVLWSVGRGRVAALLCLCFVGAEATTWALKFAVARARPDFLDGITAASPSFPSAHATVAGSVYGFVALLAASDAGRWRGAVLGVGAAIVLLVGFSRVFLSLHYFTDVLAGYAVAGVWLLLAWRLARPYVPNPATASAHLPTRPFGPPSPPGEGR